MVNAVELGLQRRSDSLGDVRRAGPGQLALTLTTGGVICGYCSTGISFSDTAPIKVSSSAITIAKRGRRIKTSASLLLPYFSN